MIERSFECFGEFSAEDSSEEFVGKLRKWYEQRRDLEIRGDLADTHAQTLSLALSQVDKMHWGTQVVPFHAAFHCVRAMTKKINGER